MVGLVVDRTDGNFNIRLIFRKKDQAGIAGKDLIAEVLSRAEEDPSAE